MESDLGLYAVARNNQKTSRKKRKWRRIPGDSEDTSTDSETPKNKDVNTVDKSTQMEAQEKEDFFRNWKDFKSLKFTYYRVLSAPDTLFCVMQIGFF